MSACPAVGRSRGLWEFTQVAADAVLSELLTLMVVLDVPSSVPAQFRTGIGVAGPVKCYYHP